MIEIKNLSTYDGPGILVCRPSCLGNPCSHKYGTLAKIQVETREQSLQYYRLWLPNQMKDPESPAYKRIMELVEIYEKTGSLTLLCWCKPLGCHADTIRTTIEGILFDRNESKW